MKESIYDQVTNRIIAMLEEGIIPWKSPYFSKVGYPKNYISGKEYRGINVFLLASHRYTSPYFLTYLQAKELGGNVRKGERGSLVIKYGTFSKEVEDAAPGESEERRYLKGYTVFNTCQIEGINFPPVEALLELPVTDSCDRARQIIESMPKAPPIKEGVAMPCYERSSDCVFMPERCFFDSEEGYYSTIFHELAHSTGHESRLARKSLLENKGMDATGEARKVYAEEELVAEMAASFLNAEAGIMEAEIENSAAYLQGWINALKSNDSRGWIIKAASEAQKAAAFILGRA